MLYAKQVLFVVPSQISAMLKIEFFKNIFVTDTKKGFTRITYLFLQKKNYYLQQNENKRLVEIFFTEK